MPIVIETVEDFHLKHGDSAYDDQSDRRYFADGAMIAGIARYEPPTDERELIKQLANYAQSKVNLLVSRFNVIRTNVQTQAKFAQLGVGPEPSPDAIPALKKLADEIIEWKIKVEKLDRKIHPNQPKQHENIPNLHKTLSDLQQLPTF
jgi:hypothetical protein